MGLQFSITAIGTIIVQGAVNIYGSVYMAGFSAAGKLQNIIVTVFVAFGATMATFVGQNRGAGKMDRVKEGMKYTQIMVLIWSVITMIIMFFFGKYMTWLFIDKSQTDVINVSVTYFHTVFWAYPFLGSIFLYRNGLQGLGYGLVPMLGGVFELVARSAIVMFVAGKTSFAGVCLADPADSVLYLCDEKVEQGKKGNCCLSGHNTENEKNKFRLAIMEDTVIMIL